MRAISIDPNLATTMREGGVTTVAFGDKADSGVIAFQKLLSVATTL